jgi:hypothetical protein
MAQLPLPEVGGEFAISQIDGRLAWEIAAEITPIKDICERYAITMADFKQKLQNPMFRKAIREAKSLWKSDLNVQQRVRLKAAFLVEDSLLDIFAIIKSENSLAVSKLDAFKKLIETADLTPKSANNGTVGNGFRVNIILGDTPSDRVTIDAVAEQQPALAAG